MFWPNQEYERLKPVRLGPFSPPPKLGISVGSTAWQRFKTSVLGFRLSTYCDDKLTLGFACLSSTLVYWPCYPGVEYLRFVQHNLSFSQPLVLGFFWLHTTTVWVCFTTRSTHSCSPFVFLAITASRFITNLAYISVICGKVSRIYCMLVCVIITLHYLTLELFRVA